MASDKEYLEYVLDELSLLDDISYKRMMGEYLIYNQGKYVAAICDNRFLVKPAEGAKKLIPDAPMEIPYEGAKEMILIESPENRELNAKLLETIYFELPDKK